MRELASLSQEGDKKDTLSILYPKEIPVTGAAKDISSRQAPPRPRVEGYPATKPSVAAVTPPSETPPQESLAEKTETSDAGELRAEETLLAQEDARAETESGEQPAGRAADEGATRRQEKQQITQPLASEDAAARDVRRKARTRTAPAEAQTRASAAAALRPDSILVSGKIVSAEDGEALPGVNVVIKGTSKGTVTDAQGQYQLAVPNDARLQFAFIGFETAEYAIPAQGALDVQLQENVMQLSEVVVTGYGVSTGNAGAPSTAFRLAEPVGGRADFKDYLSRSLKYPAAAVENKVEGRVTVRFTVEPDGQLTGFEVVKGIGYGCDEELIRLIRQGPSWKPSAQGERAVRDQVKVRYRFELPR
jgi:TonB family protein